MCTFNIILICVYFYDCYAIPALCFINKLNYVFIKLGLLCYVMLCYVMLCYVMLCYVMLCYIMLCYVVAVQYLLPSVILVRLSIKQLFFVCYFINYLISVFAAFSLGNAI